MKHNIISEMDDGEGTTERSESRSITEGTAATEARDFHFR